MKPSLKISTMLVLATIIFCFAISSAQAAVRTWSGAGADNNWNTAANWGGTAPVNADIALFSGTTRQNNTNNISNLSLNGLSFANNGFTLNGNLMSLNGPLTNSAGINILAQGVNVTVQQAVWNIAAGSELRIAGQFTNNTTANPLALLGFGGTVRFTSTNCLPNRFFTLTSGAVIVDGGVVTTGDGFRLQPPSGSTAVLQITNSGSLTLAVGANLRLCQTATGGSSRVDISSGILNNANTSGGGAGDIFVGEAAATTTVFNQNGGLVEFLGNGNNRIAFCNASASASGTYNLNGGILCPAQIVQVTAGSPGGTFNFNGGTLKALSNSVTFFQGVQSANILSGGAVIDTTNLNVTIGESLPGVGGLTKFGSGTLTLTGNNTYTGNTVINGGTLVTTAASFLGNGVITVASNANLSVTFSGSTLGAGSLNVGSSITNSVTINLGVSPSSGGNPVFAVTNLNGTGTALINITGSSFAPGNYPLIAYTNASGLSSIQLGSLPLGLSASLVTAGNVLSLNVALVPKNLEWSGNANANWDTASIDWFDLNNGSNPTNYTQSGSSGDAVTFDDNGGANPNVIVGITVTPSQVVFNNNGVNYTFAGAGKISGATALTMNGFGTVAIATSNNFSGGVVINAGVLQVGQNQALGTGPVTLNLGTLSSANTAAETLPNILTQNANTGVIFGDTVNTGTLNLTGGLNLGGGARTLNLNSDVVVSGALTNGGIATKTGPGQLIVMGQGSVNAQATQTAGNTIISGGQLVQTGDGWRMQDAVPGSTMYFVVTNGGAFIMTNLVTGNFRLGLAGEDTSTSYELDVAGKMVVYAAGNPANVGRVYLGIGAQKATVNLWPGGNLICGQVASGGASVSEVDFYGGTLTPTFSSTTFFQGVTNAFVQNGGVTVDTTNLSITIAQPLLAAGGGGLTKVGMGTLTLTGSNTYSGTTIINAGKLILAPAHAATGGATVNANATLAFLQSSPPATVNLPGVTANAGSALEAQLSVTNAPAAIITNLVLNGTVAVNVSGSFGVGEFPLFGYGSISGAGGLTLGNVPLGTIGTIVTNVPNQTIDLVVSSIAQTIWKGNLSGNWDTTTTNWMIQSTAVAYAQNANVLFNDTATTPGVSLTTTLTPSTMVVSNNVLNYNFSGSGILSGNMTLVKNGTNNVTISTANAYTGSTTINAGTVLLGNATALGASTATVTVQNGGSLDLVGNAPGLQPIIAGGSGANDSGALATDTTDQNNALRAVTLSSNTVIRADALFGIRTAAETDLGFIGNGYSLTKIGTNQLNLNGGQANVSGTTVWNSDLGDVNILQGTLSFERRMTMGRVTNTITVANGATLQIFALSSAVMPLQTKPVQLNDATFQANGNVATDGSLFGGPVNVAAGTNYLTALAGVTFTLEGAISGPGSIVYDGNGVISLQGTNTYTGSTIVSSGTLQIAGTGSIANTPVVSVQTNSILDVSQVSPWTLNVGQTLTGAGTVNGSVQANGTFAPGNATGTLAVNGDLNLAGNVIIEVNKSLAQSNDMANVSGALNNSGTGTLLVTNLGSALAAGDKFTVFNQPLGNGNSLTVTGGGAIWTNNLAVDGSISVVSVGPGSPEPITFTLSGGNLNLNWPTVGWRLQVQTNSLATGLNTNWATVPNSTAVNAVSLPANASNPSVFFRLVYP